MGKADATVDDASPAGSPKQVSSAVVVGREAGTEGVRHEELEDERLPARIHKVVARLALHRRSWSLFHNCSTIGEGGAGRRREACHGGEGCRWRSKVPLCQLAPSALVDSGCVWQGSGCGCGSFGCGCAGGADFVGELELF
jgi:hypothetical protein